MRFASGAFRSQEDLPPVVMLESANEWGYAKMST
jgi:hypothetical protein